MYMESVLTADAKMQKNGGITCCELAFSSNAMLYLIYIYIYMDCSFSVEDQLGSFQV